MTVTSDSACKSPADSSVWWSSTKNPPDRTFTLSILWSIGSSQSFFSWSIAFNSWMVLVGMTLTLRSAPFKVFTVSSQGMAAMVTFNPCQDSDQTSHHDPAHLLRKTTNSPTRTDPDISSQSHETEQTDKPQLGPTVQKFWHSTHFFHSIVWQWKSPQIERNSEPPKRNTQQIHFLKLP